MWLWFLPRPWRVDVAALVYHHQLAAQILTPASFRAQPGSAFTLWLTPSTFSPALFPAPSPPAASALFSFKEKYPFRVYKHVLLINIFNTLMSTCLGQKDMVSIIFNQKPCEFPTRDTAAVKAEGFHKQVEMHTPRGQCYSWTWLTTTHIRPVWTCWWAGSGSAWGNSIKVKATCNCYWESNLKHAYLLLFIILLNEYVDRVPCARLRAFVCKRLTNMD